MAYSPRKKSAMTVKNKTPAPLAETSITLDTATASMVVHQTPRGTEFRFNYKTFDASGAQFSLPRGNPQPNAAELAQISKDASAAKAISDAEADKRMTAALEASPGTAAFFQRVFGATITPVLASPAPAAASPAAASPAPAASASPSAAAASPAPAASASPGAAAASPAPAASASPGAAASK
jgi:hypothetical protein